MPGFSTLAWRTAPACRRKRKKHRQLLPGMMLKDVIRPYPAPNPLDILQLVAKHHNCDVTKAAVILVIDGLQNIFDNQHVNSHWRSHSARPFCLPVLHGHKLCGNSRCLWAI
jgi:hypothetical protein